MSSKPNFKVEHWYERPTGTITFLLIDADSKKCAIIDPLLDYDAPSATTKTTSVDPVLARVAELGLDVEWILETHVHADHLSSSRYLKERLAKTDGSAPPVAIGENIVEVLKFWKPMFNAGDRDMPSDGKQFDKLFKEGEEFKIGGLKVQVMYTPGHTPACITYYLPECGIAFVGDTVFNPEMGNARADFPGGSPATLFQSARRLLTLPEATILYVGHDYPGEGKPPVAGVTVADHKKSNCTLRDGITEKEFVDANSDKLPVPRLLLPSLQVNLRAGGFGEPESNGKQYIKLPVNIF